MRKYRNTPVTIDGVRFDSAKEGKRYQELRLLQRAGKIENLVLQPEYIFPVEYDSGRRIRYRADFKYLDCDTGKVVVEDVKGFRTKVYRIKKAMLKYFHDIDVTEI